MDFFFANVAHASVDTFIASVNGEIINPLIKFLFALALALFLYGAFEFILHGSSDEKRTIGKSHMLWGVVGLTIMMGVWFLLGVILRTFDLDGQINPKEGTVELPEYP